MHKIHHLSKNSLFVISMLLSLYAIAVSFVAESVGYYPCTLCNLQRAACLAIFFTSTLGMFTTNKKIPYLANQILYIGLSFFATYHLLVRYSLLPDPCKTPAVHPKAEKKTGCSQKFWEPFGIPPQVLTLLIGSTLFTTSILASPKKTKKSQFTDGL
ncbi:MAG: disulfide bond formation protein B [Candidatus Algichlamydia australiensis]|nr:disulfide bond formation protein B [Chlamydiales bacterium]